MEVLSLVISVIAIIVAIVAYQRAGGVADLRRQTENLARVGDTVTKATESWRDRTADMLERLEKAVRGTEEKKEEAEPEKKEEERTYPEG